jgi:hypothetical protein
MVSISGRGPHEPQRAAGAALPAAWAFGAVTVAVAVVLTRGSTSRNGSRDASPSNGDSDGLRTAVEELERRAFTTYKTRVQSCNRLRSRALAWNASMVAFAAAIAVATVGLLSKAGMYGAEGDTLLAALAILSLVASLIVAGMDYGGRSRAMEANYKRLQALSVEAESFFVDAANATTERYARLQAEYYNLIAASENQTTGDWRRTSDKSPAPSVFNDRAIAIDVAVTAAPYLSLLFPIVLLVPFARSILG